MPYQAAPHPPLTEALGRACAQAVHVITPTGRVLRAGRASLYVLDGLGWQRLAWLGGRRPLVWLVEAGYWLVARGRRVLSRLP